MNKASTPGVTVRDRNRPDFGLATSTIVVRARCLDAVGAFDEQLRMYEDLDLWVRLLHAHPIGFLPWATTVFWSTRRTPVFGGPTFPRTCAKWSERASSRQKLLRGP